MQKRFFAEGEYVLTGTKKYLTLTDHLGSVRDLIDITSTPTFVGSFDYTPYGAVARSWGTVTPGYTYAGLFAHPSTGLLLSATRAYDPAKGRWINKDPIRVLGGINLYGYVGGSPMLAIDPQGLAQIRVCLKQKSISVTGNNDKVLLETDALPGCKDTRTPTGNFKAVVWQATKTNPKYPNTQNPGYWNGYGPWFLQVLTPGGEYHGIGIHGSTPGNLWLPWACSHGCIRLHNSDVIKLHDLLPNPSGTPISIVADCAGKP